MSQRRVVTNIAGLTGKAQTSSPVGRRSDQADVVRRADERADVRARVHVLAPAVLVRERELPAPSARGAVRILERRHAVVARPAVDLFHSISACGEEARRRDVRGRSGGRRTGGTSRRRGRSARRRRCMCCR